MRYATTDLLFVAVPVVKGGLGRGTDRMVDADPCLLRLEREVLGGVEPQRGTECGGHQRNTARYPARASNLKQVEPPVTVHAMPYQTRSVPDQRRIRIV
jgi:hypothetical protein